ncbi:hypothetical protein DPMN_185296 [Dreissena polymorpha]|uniref:Uncharacterized protein n=1 Tax=Dreissena polymorpha TaxID=45954 RepID=A0A9D4DLM8_DREPO|nr:hypothetical protein DPMN_185296 [Dreissena polymorpha]
METLFEKQGSNVCYCHLTCTYTAYVQFSQEVFGKRSPNAALSEIAQECGRLEEGHRKGSQSNRTLHAAMNTHINNLKLLSSPLEDLQKLLPSIDKERGMSLL